MVTLGENSNETEAPRKSGYVPRAIYKVRVKEEPKAEKSKKGNPMLVFNVEIIDPTLVIVDGKECDIAGTDVKIWAVLPPANTFQLEQLHVAMNLPFKGVPLGEDGKPEGISYAAQEFYAMIRTERVEQKREGTEEVLLNPLTGKPMTSNRISFEKAITPET